MALSPNGIRVLDMSRIPAGPGCCQAGSAGADSAYFLSANRNKRSMTVDLNSETDIRRLSDAGAV